MIISDVGGTNGRFAVAHSDSEGNIDHLSHINVYQCRDYNTFTDMLETFINSLNIPPPKTARLAIAGEMTMVFYGIITGTSIQMILKQNLTLIM